MNDSQRADRRIIPMLPPGSPPWFPEVEQGRDSGLIAVGGDLSVDRLVYAYSRGIFPWYDKDTPIMWWSPDPRCVIFPSELHVPRRLARILRQGRFELSINQAFEEVIRHCADAYRPGQSGTWLIEDMVAAYLELHRQGYAISVETWQDGRLVGGSYGVLLGKVFFGESMFHLRPDASKAALVYLIKVLQYHGVQVIDCQQTTPHIVQLGGREIPRQQFLDLVARAVED